jgi:2-polyprenyl-3-methyl-5-hydroxy-6-metoxy-1,4-benzoquinol methylase
VSESNAFYEDLSVDYDRFVDWGARLSFELPFLLDALGHAGAGDTPERRRVLDVACGTGHHAIAFAQAGLDVTAVDGEPAMVARARENAREAGVGVSVLQLRFGELAQGLDGRFEAMTCLGNSLPHLLTEDDLAGTLSDMAAVLRPGGALVVQNRNFDRVLAKRERFMQPETHLASDGEWIFYRFYDWEGETLRFNMVRLHREGDAPWLARVRSTILRPWRASELGSALEASGFSVLRTVGSYRGEPHAEESPDLVLVAQRR